MLSDKIYIKYQRERKPRNHESILSTSKRFFSSPKHPDQL